MRNPPPSSQSDNALKRWARHAKVERLKVEGYTLAATLCWALIALSLSFAVSDPVSDGGHLLLTCGIGACAVLLRSFLLWRAELAADCAGRAMVRAARDEILHTASLKGAAVFASTSSGTATSRLIDRTQKLAGYAARWLPGMRLSVLGPLISLAVVFSQSWVAGVLLGVTVCILPVFIWLTASGAAAAAQSEQAALDTLVHSFQSRAAHAGLIRAFRAVSRESTQLAVDSEALRLSTLRILQRAFLSTAVLEFFASVSIALVAVYVGFKLLGIFPFETGEVLTLQEGMAVLVIAPEFFAPIRRLASLHHDRADAVAAAKTLGPWLEQASAITTERLPRLHTAPTIMFKEAVLGDQTQAFTAAMSWTAVPGQILALSGPSGSGKSTGLAALLGLCHVRSGQILYNGTPLKNNASLAESVAYVRQTPWVTEGTLAHNLRLARADASEHQLYDAITMADATDLIDASQGTLQRKLSRFGSGLSGGQRQRLALARALLRDAPVLLLDEPTAHLDSDAEQRFIELLHQLKKGRTVILASHRQPLLNAADRVIGLKTLDPKGVSR